MAVNFIDVFTFEALDNILKLDATLLEASTILQCSEDYIQTKIKEEHGLTFTAYKKKVWSSTTIKLKTKILNKALKEGHWESLKLLLKNKCGYEENPMQFDDGQSELEWL